MCLKITVHIILYGHAKKIESKWWKWPILVNYLDNYYQKTTIFSNSKRFISNKISHFQKNYSYNEIKIST